MCDDTLSDWPNWKYENITGYKVVSLVHHFTDLKKYGFNLKESSATILEPKDKEYYETIVMFGVFILAIALVMLVALMIFTILRCVCMPFTKATKRFTPFKIVVMVAFLFFIVVGILSHVAGFAGRQKVDSVMGSTCNTIEFAYNKIVNIKDKSGK